jgi:hypothetical protein
MAKHGDAKLTDLLSTLADCPRARVASIYDRCSAVYEGLRYASPPPSSARLSSRRNAGRRAEEHG